MLISNFLVSFQSPSIRYVCVTANKGINDFCPLTDTPTEEATYLSIQS